MLTRLRFPRAAIRPPRRPRAPGVTAAGVLALSIGLALAGQAAFGDDNLLRGPHPFLKDNELSAHFLLAGGFGDSWSGNKIGLDYGYRLQGPTWLNLQLNWQTGTCPRFSTGCGRSGDVFETLAGAKWKLATPIPLVPYAKAAAGPIFLFPDQARSAIGLAARAGAGVNYFFFDWLGLGLEAGLSVGHGFFDSSYAASHAYAIFDLGGGVEFQF